MALLHPFRAYRYNKKVVGDLGRVVTQPFDKISAEMQQEYYRRSPYNVARITKSLEKNENPNTDYPLAGSTFRSWLEEGVLIQDLRPSVYAYYQEYELDGEKQIRRGLTALLDLKHPGTGVLPHEHTLTEPKDDRLRLVRRIEGNDDLIFLLYTDESSVANTLLEEQVSQVAPEIEVKDDFAASHRVWSITDSNVLRKIQESMAPKDLFIADGHHRFETALNYMKECESRRWKPANVESFEKRMVTCFNSADRGMAILPTHRLIRDLTDFDSEVFLKSAGQYFEISSAGSALALWGKMKEGRQAGHVFGFYPGDTRRFSLLRLKEKAKVDSIMLAYSEAYRHLDVTLLHSLILERLLGIDKAKLAAQAHVDYARDRASCIRQVDDGRCQAAFFLNPTTVEQVQRVALMGERMPQKSTDFYPKLLTGLLFMKMDIVKP